MSGLVLSLCDYTGNMVLPWAEAGYSCMCVDTREQLTPQHDRIIHVVADVRSWLPPRTDYKIVFAAPPCTNLAVSGARWFKDKGLLLLADSLQIVESCRQIAEWSGAPWMIENPVSTMSTYWRRPDYTFDPCDYGDPYTKKTCLWTSGDFVMPTKQRVNPAEGSKIHLMSPGPDRGNARSVTPMGFANAVFTANEGKDEE